MGNWTTCKLTLKASTAAVAAAIISAYVYACVFVCVFACVFDYVFEYRLRYVNTRRLTCRQIEYLSVAAQIETVFKVRLHGRRVDGKNASDGICIGYYKVGLIQLAAALPTVPRQV